MQSLYSVFIYIVLGKEEIDSKDLEEIENLLEHVADKKMEMTKEFEELETLKEDFSEYKEVFPHILIKLK